MLDGRDGVHSAQGSYNPSTDSIVARSSLPVYARQRFPDKAFILSGGLNPENIASAVKQTQPAAVDIASGVESAPGIKDLDKVRTFIHNARSA